MVQHVSETEIKQVIDLKLNIIIDQCGKIVEIKLGIKYRSGLVIKQINK